MYNQAFHSIDLSKYTILVTGGAGFIGSNIVDYLIKYNVKTVRVLDNLETGYMENLKAHYNAPNFEMFEGDLCDISTCLNACKGADIVLHQGALGSVPRSIANPMATNNTNVNGFVNILWAAKETGVKRVVYASSSSVYGDSQGLPKVEHEIGKALSPYAVTKYTNELYADVFGKTYGMEIIGLRYFNVFGPKQNPNGPYAAVIPLFIDALMSKKAPKIFGDGEQMRDFTFVENAVQANIKAAFTENTEAFGQVFNIALGDKTSVNELYLSLKKAAHSELDAEHVGERKGDIKNSYADISKAKKMLGYDPQIRIDEGLERTFNWFKQL